jgi:AcrR family transcriptional regulator
MRIVMPAQVSFRAEEHEPEGLRSLKKLRTRRAIEDAAFALFDAQGYEDTTVDQIAARAEVSTTTFFRYFPSKSEVVLGDHGQQLPALYRAILERPADETELESVRHAVIEEFVVVIDPERTAAKARIVAASPVLQGLSYERGFRWLDVITDALARRRGLKAPDERALVAARVCLAVLASAIEGWIASGCRGKVVTAVEHAFDLMSGLCNDWSSPG